MKTKIDFALTSRNGQRVLVDRDDQPIDLMKTLARIYNPKEGERVIIRCICDDFRHEEVPFDIALAKKIIGNQVRGAAFVTASNKKVSIYNANTRGDFPLLGADIEGNVYQWNENGDAQSGDENDRLRILIKKENNKE